MVPLSSGTGYRCGQPGNRWDGKNKQWSNGHPTKWNDTKQNTSYNKPVIPRATCFPTIASPTDEQREVRRLMGCSPSQRGGRLLIIDAGPGTGKTTTISWGLEELNRRLGHLSNFPVLAFNGNARDILMGKLPPEVPDVATLNGWGARQQGYRRPQYDKQKVYNMFKEAIDTLPKDDKPNYGQVGKIVERMRDICLYNDDVGDRSWWNEAIATTLERFPSLSKKANSAAAMKTIFEYVPRLTVQAHSFRNKIDIQEQITRPMAEGSRRSRFKMKMDCCTKPASKWTSEDVTHFARLIRSIDMPSVRGMVCDEAQDLSLCQVATVLAQTWRSGELILIGDDCCGVPSDPDYKAGQAIYGWRGAFPGILQLIARLWTELTGETAVKTSLTVTFRHGPETCESYRGLNKQIRSGLPAGYSQVWQVRGAQAFAAWLAVPPGKTALWITRTNGGNVDILKDTILAGEECCIRGGKDLAMQVEGVLTQCAGWYNKQEEYRTSLADAICNLQVIVNEQMEATDDGKGEAPDSMESFTLEIMEMIAERPELLKKAELPAVATVGNVKRFVTFFANRDARRVITTVYRCKGDEADLSIVGDIEKFNQSWGDPHEDRACIHVAASRGKAMTLHCGALYGCTAKLAPDDMFAGGDDSTIVTQTVKETPALPASPQTPLALPPATPIVAVVTKPTRKPKATKAKPATPRKRKPKASGDGEAHWIESQQQ
jgi:hypothetical protein